eukprot:EG_transcript_9377
MYPFVLIGTLAFLFSVCSSQPHSGLEVPIMSQNGALHSHGLKGSQGHRERIPSNFAEVGEISAHKPSFDSHNVLDRNVGLFAEKLKRGFTALVGVIGGAASLGYGLALLFSKKARSADSCCLSLLTITSQKDDLRPSSEVMQNLVEFLKEDLSHLFDEQGIDASKYDKNVKFQDPVTQYSDLDGYLRNIQFLRLAFQPTFKLHSCVQTGPREITTRWTMGMKAWILPWQPELLFTGRTYMTVSPVTNKFDSHRDEWDSVQNNAYLSLEAVQDLMQQLFRVYATPDLKTPDYEVLRRAASYEVRQYKPYIVAETSMGVGAGIASGSGFNTLAGYIFGGNTSKKSMNMTTPVYTTSLSSQSTTRQPTMQFVMEADSPDQLPAPTSGDVQVRQVEGQLVAAMKFGGIATDGQVVEVERRLRRQLVADGIGCEEGFVCARYNEPTAPPFLRRNEVLIKLKAEYDPLAD